MGFALGLYWNETEIGEEGRRGKEGFRGNGSEVKSYKVMGDVKFGRRETKRGQLHCSVLCRTVLVFEFGTGKQSNTDAMNGRRHLFGLFRHSSSIVKWAGPSSLDFPPLHNSVEVE